VTGKKFNKINISKKLTYAFKTLAREFFILLITMISKAVMISVAPQFTLTG
jgi:hypothetical protein